MQGQDKLRKLEQRVDGGFIALIAVLIFTVVNLGIMLANSTFYFLFSAAVPYYLTWLGRIMDNGTVDGTGEIIGTYTNTALVMAGIILAVYLLCAIFYKKSRFWMALAAILLLLDTLGLAAVAVFLLEDASGVILDAVFHLWALWQLFSALFAAGPLRRLRNAPPAPAPGPAPAPAWQPPQEAQQMSWQEYLSQQSGAPQQPPVQPNQPWTYPQAQPNQPWTNPPAQPNQPWTCPPTQPNQPWTYPPTQPNQPWTNPPAQPDQSRTDPPAQPDQMPPQRRSTTPELDEQKPWQP